MVFSDALHLVAFINAGLIVYLLANDFQFIVEHVLTVPILLHIRDKINKRHTENIVVYCNDLYHFLILFPFVRYQCTVFFISLFVQRFQLDFNFRNRFQIEGI